MRRMLLATAVAVGCGDALVDETYRGRELATFSGAFSSRGAPDDGFGRGERLDLPNLRVALFWTPRGALIDDLDKLVEQAGAFDELEEIPSDYEVKVFEPPAAELLADAGHAIGRLMT